VECGSRPWAFTAATSAIMPKSALDHEGVEGQTYGLAASHSQILTQKPTSPIINSHGPPSEPTTAAQAWRGSRSSCPRLWENHFEGHLGARLIQAARRTRIKESPRLRFRFVCCVRTTASSVFTQAGPFPVIRTHERRRPARALRRQHAGSWPRYGPQRTDEPPTACLMEKTRRATISLDQKANQQGAGAACEADRAAVWRH
jgi:hypothetical protein